MADALPRDARFQVESTFGETPVWGGAPIKVIEPEFALERVEDENENITPRRHAVLDLIPGLKSDSTLAHGLYHTASGVNALDQATAVATDVSTILQAGLGGRVLGQRAQLDGLGSAAAPSVATDPGYVDGDWVFAFDDSEGTGVFLRIDDASATPVLTLLDPLPAAPDAADAFFATISVFSDELNHDHLAAGFNTLAWLIQGEHVDDVFEMSGCKPAVAIEGFEAGAKLKFGLDYMVLTWPDAMPAKEALGTPSGIAPVTVGTGTATTFKMANVGGTLTDVDCRGTTEIDLGVTWAKVPGPCGTEGNKGYKSEITAATITLRVAFADHVALVAEYEANTKKRLMIQVGDQTTNAVGVYFGYLEYTQRPARIDEGGVTTTELVFRAHEDPGAVGALTGDDLAQRRAPFHLVSVA